MLIVGLVVENESFKVLHDIVILVSEIGYGCFLVPIVKYVYTAYSKF